MTYLTKVAFPYLWYSLLLAWLCASSAFAQQVREREVVVTNGDNFSTISLREFGTAAYWRLIAEHNGLALDSQLTVGDVVRIPLQAVSSENSAEVLFAKGEPIRFFAGASDQSEILGIGDRVYRSDIIQTSASGFVSLRFPSGTAVNIQPKSTIQLTDLECLERSITCVVELTATEGSISSQVRQRGQQPTRVQMHTPHASAAVRGTVFDLDASDEQILVGVTEGEVDVTAQGRSTGVLQGLGVRTAAGQASDPPIKLLVAPSFRRLPPRVTEQDILGWYNLAGARDYLISLNRDAEGAAQLYETLLTGTRHQIQSAPAGEYFLSLRARDEHGFKGFPIVEALTVADLDAASPEVAIVLQEQGGERILTVPDLPENVLGIEVQLSFQRDFLELSSVDVPLDGGVLFSAVGVPQYARARVLLSETSVGPLGPVLELPAQ